MLTAFAAASDPSTPWWITFLATAGPALGVIIGVFLDPVKNFFGRKVQLRRDRREEASQLLAAATTARHLQVGLNQLYRRERQKTITVEPDQAHRLVAQYQEHRNALRVAVAQLRLLGPDELADEAKKVEDAERLLADLRYSAPTAVSEYVGGIPADVHGAAGALDAAVDAFAQLAAKYTR